MPKLSNAVNFTPQFWTKLAKEIIRKWKKHIFIDGLDVNGKPFRPYSPQYKKLKRELKFPRQDRAFKDRKPSLVLTGDMERDLKITGAATKKGVTIGWAAHGAKVRAANKSGRLVSTADKPFAKPILEYMEKQISNHIKKGLNKAGGNKTYKI